MSGRQLRHVNAEKKLEEWKAEAQEYQRMLGEEEEDEDKDGEIDVEVEEFKQGDCLMKVNEESGSSHTSNAVSASDRKMTSVMINGMSETVSRDHVSSQQICITTIINDNCGDREADVELNKYESISLLGENSSSSCVERENSIESKKEMLSPLSLRQEQNITCLNSDREPNVELKTEDTKSSMGEDDDSCDDKEAASGSTSIITNVCGEKSSICASNDSVGEPLEFDEFNTSKDIERLGLERLKK